MESDKLKNYKSENGVYTIPVEWSVWSTVSVEADNLQDAYNKASAMIDKLPLTDDNEYVEDSYVIAADDPEDLITAQGYKPRSGVAITKDNKII